MKIARIEFDLRTLGALFAIGLVPGFIAPGLVWLHRVVQGGEMDGDFWLGIGSSYGVAIATAVFLAFLLGEGATAVTLEQDRRQRKEKEDLASFLAVHDDPLFGPPLTDLEAPAATVSAGRKGEGGYYPVHPKDCAPPEGCKVTVFHHSDGFHPRQRDMYRHIVTNFDEVWASLLPQISDAYRAALSTNKSLSPTAWLTEIKIGKDEPDTALGYMLSVEYAQDQYVDVWVMGATVTKTEFWM